MALLDVLDIRLKAMSKKLTFVEIEKAEFSKEPLKSIISRALELINLSVARSKETRLRIRKTLEAMTDLEILPEELAHPRRYFCEHAYLRPHDPPEKRFIYVALDCVFHSQGYPLGMDDPRVADVKLEVAKRFEKFYAIRPNTGWSEKKASGDTSPGIAAFELARLLTRLFFAEGLAVDLLDSFRSYEELIYYTKPRYRDHYVHVLYVFLLGCRYLEILMPRIYEQWRWYTDEEPSKEQVYLRTMRSWILSSLFHDIGYAAEALASVQKSLQEKFFSHIPGFSLSQLKLNQDPYIQNEVKEFFVLLSSVLKDTEYDFSVDRSLLPQHERASFPDNGMLTSMAALFQDQLDVDALDHGVASALFALLTLRVDTHEISLGPVNYSPQSLTPDERIKRQAQYELKRREVHEDLVSACLAMALHNIRLGAYPGLSVKFSEHPLAFLLMLCDDLQEWDRAADWERTPQRLRAVYGLNAFLKCEDSAALFADKQTVTPLIGKGYDTGSFFGYLRGRISLIGGKPINASEIDRAARSLQIFFAARADIRGFEARQCLRNQLETMNLSPETKVFFEVLSMSLEHDVLTLTYVGGDREKRFDEADNRMVAIWKALDTTFTRNLTEGPAICILHGFDDENVTLFFVAEYSQTLREYRVKDGQASFQGANK